MIVYTIKADTVVFNQNGGIHGSSPIKGFKTRLEISDNTREIPGRGVCYRITATGAFILTSDVTAVAPPPVDPPPPPPPPPSPVLPADMDIVLAKGSKLTVKDTNGNIVFTYNVP